MSEKSEDLLGKLLEKLSELERQIAAPKVNSIELNKILLGLEGLQRDQRELIEAVSEIKKVVLDPDAGAIARIKYLENWSTDKSKFLDEVLYPTLQEHHTLVLWKDAVEEIISNNETQNQQLLLLNEWKGGVSKVIWTLCLSAAAMVLKVIFDVVVDAA